MKLTLWKMFIGILTLAMSCLSGFIGMMLLAASNESFLIRFLYGLCFVATPILVLQMMIASFRRQPKKPEETAPAAQAGQGAPQVPAQVQPAVPQQSQPAPQQAVPQQQAQQPFEPTEEDYPH